MAIVDLALGAKLDVVTGDELENGVNKVIDELSRHHYWPKCDYFIKSGSYVADAGGEVQTQVISVGGPPVGRMWNMLALSVCGGTDLDTASAGDVLLYVGPEANTTGQLMLTGLIDPAIGIPSKQYFNPGVYWITHGDAIMLKTSSVTGVTQVLMNVHIAEYRESDIQLRAAR